MTHRLLLIDDDENLLKGLMRQYRKRFDLVIATSGQDALDLIKQDPTISVVVSDMRMPGMDGLATLKAIRDINPDIIRMMLTGNADQQTAVDAVNEGAIFRFYNKPCDNEILAKGIEDGFKLYDTLTAEKILLEKTLAGTVKFLLDLLSFSNPEAFARSAKVRDWCKKLATPLEIKETWRLDFAAMMLPLADLILPQNLLIRKERGEQLSEDELESLRMAPLTIQQMLKQIPRLEDIADIVAFANASHTDMDVHALPLEAKILRILSDLSKRTAKDQPQEKSFQALVKNIQDYDEALFAKIQKTLLESKGPEKKYETMVVGLAGLRPGHTLLSDIYTEDERMLLSHGCILSPTHIQKLKAIARSIGISKEITVAKIGY
ncbi:response regulator [Terasakiella pusilla]|uniref:response regulator n=1 Tax=Terasakiella pusilla TaxID=64973 RepID=UPI003AA932C6